jgi:phosphatidylinositol alpha-1,6-mannosyltransferase
LPPDEVTVLTAGYAGADEFDHAQPFRIERTVEPVLLPTPWLVRRIEALAHEVGATLVVLDPAIPLGLVGLRLRLPYAVIVHGAEVSVPGRLPGVSAVLARVLGGASLVVSGGGWALGEVRRAASTSVPAVVVTPGVDVGRFRPLPPDERRAARIAHGLPHDGRLVVSVTRLVPRKGIDVLVAASALLAPDYPDLSVAVGGTGRDAGRLARLISTTGAPVRLLGRLRDRDLPGLVAAADVFAMPCRRRWGGLEQEGFGIVFLEAAACGVPQVAGDSGGAGEAVSDGETGFVVSTPDDPVAVADALAVLLDDADLRARMGEAARRRAEADFSYDRLAQTLGAALRAVE